MKLLASVPEPVEYQLELTTASPAQPNQPVQLTFQVLDPWKSRPVTRFSVVHEKLFHAFIVSRDLQFFRHYHPTWRDGVFTHEITLPRSGMYRLLADFYPEASTPQLAVKTLFAGRDEAIVPVLARDLSAKRVENSSVELEVTPAEPVAGEPAQLRVRVAPGETTNVKRGRS
jgi:hypothetical protein